MGSLQALLEEAIRRCDPELLAVLVAKRLVGEA